MAAFFARNCWRNKVTHNGFVKLAGGCNFVAGFAKFVPGRDCSSARPVLTWSSVPTWLLLQGLAISARNPELRAAIADGYARTSQQGRDSAVRVAAQQRIFFQRPRLPIAS
jgi:hypothetical protein